MNSIRIGLAILSLHLLVPVFGARAESGGRIGPSSSGTAEISLEIPQALKAADMPELIFPARPVRTAQSAGEVGAAAQLSILSNDDQEYGAFTILGTGSGVDGAFELQSTLKQDTTPVHYEVLIGESGQVRMENRLNPIRPVLIHNAGTAQESVHTLRVKLPNGKASAPVSGTLTLLLSPE